MSVACCHGEQRLGDLPSALIVIYDAGHQPILPYRSGPSYFERVINIIRVVDHIIPAASCLTALAAVVSAAACVAAWRAVPWQGRQSSLIMAAAMIVIAGVGGGVGTALVLGAVLLLSAMLGTVGVRGTPSAASCCHRALVSLVMALCAFDGASTGEAVAGGTGHGGHGADGLLSGLTIVGVIGVVLWTVAAEWLVEPAHRGRTARLLTVESWAMAAGVAVMAVGF